MRRRRPILAVRTNEVFLKRYATRLLLDFYRERMCIKKSKTRPPKTTADHNIIVSRFFLPGPAGELRAWLPRSSFCS